MKKRWRRDGRGMERGGGRRDEGGRRREEKGGKHVAGREGVWVGR